MDLGGIKMMLRKRRILVYGIFILVVLSIYAIGIYSQGDITGNIAMVSPTIRGEGGVDCDPCNFDTCVGKVLKKCDRTCKLPDGQTAYEFGSSKTCAVGCVVGGGKPSLAGGGNNGICWKNLEKNCNDGDPGFCLEGGDENQEIVVCVTNSPGKYKIKKCDDTTAGGPSHCEGGHCVQDISG